MSTEERWARELVVFTVYDLAARRGVSSELAEQTKIVILDTGALAA